MTSQKKYPSLNQMISLKAKQALITGGAMGIGFSVAFRLAEAGASVTIADLNSDRGQKAADDLNNLGYQAFFLHCDVSKEEDVANMVTATIARTGAIDILVNNAGIFPLTPIFQTTGADIEKIFSVNLKGLVYCTREVSRWMIEKKRSGSIINIASIDSLHPSHKGMSIYDASKGAVLTLTKSLAKELGAEGIRVNAIAPGGILTEGSLAPGDLSVQVGRAGLKEFLRRTALGRMGAADDIGRVALFLASDLSAYMTGSLLVVDGGYLLG